MNKYRLLSKKGEGTFSEVLKAQSIATQRYVAIKCMKTSFQSVEQVNQLREIQALRKLSGHANVIRLHEVLFDTPTGRLALVFELMDLNLYESIRGRRQYLPEGKVKRMMFQVLQALDFMNRSGIFHRDIKPENILVSTGSNVQVTGGAVSSSAPQAGGQTQSQLSSSSSSSARGGGPQPGGKSENPGDKLAQSSNNVVKVADFGSCRGVFSPQPYTEYISTRWYRAPECLITSGLYTWKMDSFALGCVWFEVLALFPLFPGADEHDQIERIHSVLGSPSADLIREMRAGPAGATAGTAPDLTFSDKRGTGLARLIPHVTSELVRLLNLLLAYAPEERLQPKLALQHTYFRDIVAEDEGTAQPSQSGAAQQHTQSQPQAQSAQQAQSQQSQSSHGHSEPSSQARSIKGATKGGGSLVSLRTGAHGRGGVLERAGPGDNSHGHAGAVSMSSLSGHKPLAGHGNASSSSQALPPIGGGAPGTERRRHPGGQRGAGGGGGGSGSSVGGGSQTGLGSTLTRFSNGNAGLGGGAARKRNILGNAALLATTTHTSLGVGGYHAGGRADHSAAALGATQSFRGRRGGRGSDGTALGGTLMRNKRY